MSLRHGAPRWGVRLMLAAAAFVGLPAAVAAPPDAARLEEETLDALWLGDVADLRRLVEAHGGDPEQVDGDGKRLRPALRKGLRRALTHKAKGPLYHANLSALTLQWVQQDPRWAFAYALHAQALTSQAWWYRGPSFAKDVPRQAWADFEKHMGQAQTYLAANAAIALDEAWSYSVLFDIAKATSFSGPQIAALAQDALKRHPREESIYFWWVDALSPKWHGSVVNLDNAVQEAVRRTRADRGMEMYARLYSDVAEYDVESRLFEDTSARWPLMQQGFADWLKRRPDSAVRNRLAYMACMAQDRAALQDALDKLEGAPLLDQWGKNPGRTYETCRRWAQTQ